MGRFRKLGIWGGITVLALSGYLGIKSCQISSSIGKTIRQVPAYSEAENLGKVKNYINCAERNLIYDAGGTTVSIDANGNLSTDYEPPTYPDAGDSRESIKKSLYYICEEDINKTENIENSFDKNSLENITKVSNDVAISRKNSKKLICKNLRKVYSSLPNENNILNYNGKFISNDTFANQRILLSEIDKEVNILKNEYENQIPKSLTKNKIKEDLKFFGFILGGIAGLGLGFYNFLMRREEIDY